MRKQALVTGGSRGIGLAVAEFLASEHYDLMLWILVIRQVVRPVSVIFLQNTRLLTFY